MEDLTIVIRDDDEKNIYGHLNTLEPLLANNNIQLCILTNTIKKIDINIEYSLFSYDKKIKNLLQFSEGISKYNQVLLIDKGMKINGELVDRLKQILENGKQLSYQIRTHNYYDNYDYYEDIETIIFYKDSDKTINLEQVVKNYCLIETTMNDIDLILNKLVSRKQYENIFKWYKQTLIHKDESCINSFIESIEIIKTGLTYEQVNDIESYFLNDSYNELYEWYLKLKQLIIIKNYEEMPRHDVLLRRLSYSEDFKYFAFLFYHAIKNGFDMKRLYLFLETNIIENIITYLMNTDELFYLYLYKYIVSIDIEIELSKPGNHNIHNYLSIVRGYMINMAEKSYTEDLKEKVMQIFIEYTNYLFYAINKANNIELNQIGLEEQNFIVEIEKAINNINNNRMKEGILSLENASLILQYAELPVRFYIQKLIRENTSYYNKISICMIAKNEEKHIKRCLNSLKPLLECGLAEIIVVDTGSTDKTVELARKYTKNIYYYEWKNDFAAARNYSIAMAKGEYIFVIDADEEFDKKGIEEFKAIFNTGEYKKYNTFSFKEKNFYEETYSKFGVFTRNFIFKNNPGFCYRGSIHEQPQFQPEVKNFNIYILHYGYILDDEVKEKKYIRNAELLRKELALNPNNLYYRFQMCTTYAMHNDCKEALTEAELLLKGIQKTEYIDMHLMYYNEISLIYAFNGMYDKVIEICDIGLKYQSDFIDFIFDKGEALFIKEEYNAALEYIEKYLKLLEEFDKHEIYNNPRFLFHTLASRDKAINLAIVSNYVEKKYDDLLTYLDYINDDNTLRYSLRVIVECYFRCGKLIEMKEFYKTKIVGSTDDNLEFDFKYFVQKELFELGEEKALKVFDIIKDIGLDFREIFNINNNNSSMLNKYEAFLGLITNFDISKCDVVTAKLFVYDILELLENYAYQSVFPDAKARSYKNCLRFMLIRTLTIKQFKGLTRDKLLDLVNRYIDLGLSLSDNGRENVLELKEKKFFENFKASFKALEKGDILEAIRSIKHSITEDNEMARPMELLLAEILPEYNIKFN